MYPAALRAPLLMNKPSKIRPSIFFKRKPNSVWIARSLLPVSTMPVMQSVSGTFTTLSENDMLCYDLLCFPSGTKFHSMYVPTLLFSFLNFSVNTKHIITYHTYQESLLFQHFPSASCCFSTPSFFEVQTIKDSPFNLF